MRDDSRPSTQFRLKIDSSTREYAQHLRHRGLRWHDTPARRRGCERHLHLDPRRRRARGGRRRVAAALRFARKRSRYRSTWPDGPVLAKVACAWAHHGHPNARWLASGTITSSSGHLTTDTWAAYLVHGGGDQARRTAPGQIPHRSRHDVERRRVTSVSRQRSRSARRPFTQPPDDLGQAVPIASIVTDVASLKGDGPVDVTRTR